MENKSNEATPQRPGGNRQLDAMMVTIDLPVFMKQIKEEKPWLESDRNAMTVFKTDGMRIVLIALHAGAEMATHTANGIISVQVLEGRIKFSIDQQSVELTKNQVVTLHERIPHSVLAKEESIFLLTLSSPVMANT